MIHEPGKSWAAGDSGKLWCLVRAAFGTLVQGSTSIDSFMAVVWITSVLL